MGQTEQKTMENPGAEEPDRTTIQYTPYFISAIAYLVVPVLIAWLVPADIAVLLALIYLPVVSIILGVLDALMFRFTWAYAIISGVFFWIATRYAFADGAAIYLIAAVPCILAGDWMTSRIKLSRHHRVQSPIQTATPPVVER